MSDAEEDRIATALRLWEKFERAVIRADGKAVPGWFGVRVNMSGFSTIGDWNECNFAAANLRALGRFATVEVVEIEFRAK